MNVIHLSAECYPVAKVGGLGDVLGALPKYQCLSGLKASVVMPYYDRKFVRENDFEVVYEAASNLGNRPFNFQILKERTNKLGFPLYLVHIPGLLDREEVYAYNDETEQFVAYQLAFLDWMVQTPKKPDVIHCHDHHSGLVPFLISHSGRYRNLSAIRTVCTIHNGQYQGWFGWNKVSYLPEIDLTMTGLLDWGGCINPLATAVKCCDMFTTVSPSYLEELSINSHGLEHLFQMDKAKGRGIINGIDMQVWDPGTDQMIVNNYTTDSLKKGKFKNKKLLCHEFGLAVKKPLFAFIGRLVSEKGSDLLPEIIAKSLLTHKNKINFIVLGSGELVVENKLKKLYHGRHKNYNVFIGYDEMLSHRIYAGADFLLMPSRVEPCGLNQLYSMRYGTMPMVRRTGGLKDTVVDFDTPKGYGITFEEASIENVCEAVDRAVKLYSDETKLNTLQKRMMSLDFSWNTSAKQYINLYKSLKHL